MKKIIAMVALVSVVMTGCNSRQQTKETIIDIVTESTSQTTMNETEGTTIITEPAYEAETQASASVSETTVGQDDDYKEKAYAAYKTTLENVLYNYTLPDGTTFTEDDVYSMSDNSFLIYDVDNDGRDELILLYTDTYMAAMAGYILDCDSDGNTEIQLTSFPSFDFYGNGVIEIGASHGSGLSGEFWPYTLLSYNSETDSYAEAAYVDGYDKKSMDEMYEITQDPQYIYPAEIDKSGSGVVYAVADGENAKFFNSDEYEEWHGRWVENSEKLELPYMALTQENIDKAFEG
ncbi:MAG: hypothetical protein IKK42_02035 [Oscillospiraceae bacterium]|nr:hypothetical protein [Oscillospiraceae bacterium]